MKYYLLVNEIKEEHKPGIYGRRKPSSKELTEILSDLKLGIHENLKNDLIPKSYASLTNLVKKVSNILKRNHQKQKFVFQSRLPDESQKQLIIKYNLLNDNYYFDEDFTYGLFDNLSSKEKHDFFKTIMTSKGGSSLIILERNVLPPNIKHYGGEKGIFNVGLYVPHPKNEDLLIPLNKFKELIQTLIIEEIARAFEALGAKKILIEDSTKIDSKTNSKIKNIKVNTDIDYSKQVLRVKEFGKGTFDPERALRNKLFIHDMPAVMSTIDARINGNQTLEEFSEIIDLNIGIDINVLNLFESNSKISYQRKWYFMVQFYDKNDIDIKTNI